jgi:hypothetical protein
MELAQNAVTKKRMATNVKMWFDAERYRFNQPKINNNRRNSYNEIDETLVLPWIVMKIFERVDSRGT